MGERATAPPASGSGALLRPGWRLAAGGLAVAVSCECSGAGSIIHCMLWGAGPRGRRQRRVGQSGANRLPTFGLPQFQHDPSPWAALAEPWAGPGLVSF